MEAEQLKSYHKLKEPRIAENPQALNVHCTNCRNNEFMLIALSNVMSFEHNTTQSVPTCPSWVSLRSLNGFKLCKHGLVWEIQTTKLTHGTSDAKTTRCCCNHFGPPDCMRSTLEKSCNSTAKSLMASRRASWHFQKEKSLWPYNLTKKQTIKLFRTFSNGYISISIHLHTFSVSKRTSRNFAGGNSSRTCSRCRWAASGVCEVSAAAARAARR